MARRRRQEQSGGGSPVWLTTYSDLVTLLLCFFVLLFSFSVIDAEKFRSIMSSFQGGSGVLESGPLLNEPFIQDEDKSEDEDDSETELLDLLNHLEEYIETLGLGDRIVIETEERGIVIRFMEDVFFKPGSADIGKDSYEILTALAELLNREEFLTRQIKVEGHTDTVPISKNSVYPTNWELSAARATNVLRYMVEKESIDGIRISSSAYSFYRGIAPNDTAENKAKNRRVDIVILKDAYVELEP